MTRRPDDRLSEAESLDAFLPQSPLPAPPAKLPLAPAQRAPHADSNAVSLEDVLTRETPVQWDEAVAVVQNLCDLLIVGGGDEPPVPELAAILMTADGEVKLKHGARGESGAAGVGRTLHALLSSATVPVALRLFVTQSTSTEAYASIREFAAALAYFGKPGRAELVRVLYERCLARGAGASAATSTRPPDSPASKKPESKLVTRPKRRIPVWTAPVAAVACLLGGGLWFWSTVTSSPTAASSVPALMSGTKSAIQKLATEVRNSVGAGKAPATSATAQPTARPAVPTRRRAVSRRRMDDRQLPAMPLESVQTAPLHVEQTAPTALPVERPSVDPSAKAGDAVLDANGLQAIYSSADLDVQPPVLLYPQLSPPLLIGSRPEVVNRMELIVSDSGVVEHVRLIDGPRRMPDMMLLSGAKMWRFEPAVKNGARVRYRAIVSWLGVP